MTTKMSENISYFLFLHIHWPGYKKVPVPELSELYQVSSLEPLELLGNKLEY